MLTLGKQHKPLHPRQIAYPFLLAIAFCLIMGGGYVYFTTKTLDRQELTQTTHLARSALAAQLEELGNWARDYGFWDAALTHLVDRLDRAWADGNIGRYLHDSYGIDQSYALDAQNRTIIAYREGQELVAADLLASFPPALGKLIEKTRATPPENPRAATGVLRSHGQLLLVAASVITPENPGPEVRFEQPRPILVLVRALNDELFAQWSERYQLHDLHLTQKLTAEQGEFSLQDPEGEILTRLVWTLDQPGSALLLELVPLYAAVLLIIAALTFIFLVRMGHFSAEKRKTEKALRESEERLSTALETTNIGLWDWDIASGASYLSPTCYSMAGYAAAAFPATFDDFRQRVHADDRARLEQALKDHFAGLSDKYEVEFRFRRQDDQWMWLQSRGKIIQLDSGGQPARMIGIHSDISARKRAEEARTALENQLHQKNKMEAIGKLAGGIAHDFNNILAIIISNAHLALKKCQATGPVAGHLQGIQTATNRAKDLVNQILSFSRKEQLSLKPINLAATIGEALKLIQATIPSSVTLRNHIDPVRDAVTISGEATQLHRVMFNLCSNAVQAMSEKGMLDIDLKAVELDAARMPAGIIRAEGRFAELSVRDTGCGMDAETIARIYDPFFTTKVVGKGTGMGLAVVYGIMESHHGFIEVDSFPGQGATFKLYFPVHVEDVFSQAEIPAPLLGGREKILLVDDEQELTAAISETLGLLGYRVTATADSLDALQIFRADPNGFDLVITDQTMPELSGMELSAELLKIKADLPIVLCSGYSTRVSPASAQKIGIRKYCAKPLEIAQLAAVIREILDEEKGGITQKEG
jgi:PAS domain S-box-containing protein